VLLPRAIITPPATVLIAFIRSPLRMWDGCALYYMMEVGLQVALSGIEPALMEDGMLVYRLIARQQPIVVDSEGQALALASEIGPGSVVRVSLIRRKTALVIRAVSVIELRAVNLFHSG
jgi:hypothetical protein